MYKINFEKPIHIHFIGIGGISMSGLAEILLKENFRISGSDAKRSALTTHLESLGCTVQYGQCAENITDDIDAVVYTAAIHPDNPEFAACKAKGIPMLSRAELLGQLMHNYKVSIAISGTHGKTTTTSMLSEILMLADTDPTVSVGGILKSINGNIRVGGPEMFVTEACEYTNSFLNFYPTDSIILNIEEDHLDFFKDLADIEQSFRKFVRLVPEDGLIVANGDDKNTRDALEGISYISFGIESTNDVYGEHFSSDYRSFDVICGGKSYCHLELGVLGRHNAMNALAACAVAWRFDIPAEATEKALAEFRGAGRRLEFKGSYHGADVYDDYSHHPAELHALLSAVRLMGYKRVICAFQPHTYSRTKALFSDFVRELSAVDLAVLTDIYAARESNTVGVSSKDLADRIPGSVYCPGLPQLTDFLASIAQPGDIILTVGAGDVYKAGEKLLKLQ